MWSSLIILVFSYVLLCTVNSQKAGLDCSGPHEYYACGGKCDNVCSELLEQSQNNCPIKNYVNIRCKDKCYCEKGYARNDYGVCIPISECPGLCTLPNEEYTECKRAPLDLCFSLTASFNLYILDQCKPGCVCKRKFFRKTTGGPCVPQCECSEIKNTDECKGASGN